MQVFRLADKLFSEAWVSDTDECFCAFPCTQPLQIDHTVFKLKCCPEFSVLRISGIRMVIPPRTFISVDSGFFSANTCSNAAG